MQVSSFNNYNAVMAQRFGGRTAKVSLDLNIPCPHRERDGRGCLFCQPGVIIPDRIGELGDIQTQIDVGIPLLKKRYKAKAFLAYFQDETSSAGETEWLLRQYRTAFDDPRISGVVLSTRPDFITGSFVDAILDHAGGKPLFIELGLQSTHDKTLRRINRGHDYATFAHCLTGLAQRPLDLAAHVILGLPGEDHTMMMQTAQTLATLPLDSLKIHHLQIYPQSELRKDWDQGQIPVFAGLDDYLPVLVDFLERIPWRIAIQRVVADAPKQYVLAPQWTETKNEILSHLEAEFQRRQTRQGSRSV